MSVHLVYGLFLMQFVLGVSLFHLDYDIRLFSFTDAKGFISTSLFVLILKLVLNVSILSLKNLLNRLAD